MREPLRAMRFIDFAPWLPTGTRRYSSASQYAQGVSVTSERSAGSPCALPLSSARPIAADSALAVGVSSTRRRFTNSPKPSA